MIVLDPAGIALVLKMIPGEVMSNARDKAKKANGQDGRIRWVGAAIVIYIWLGLMALVVYLTLRFCKKTA